MRKTEQLYERVIEKMDMTCEMEDTELQELIHEVLEEANTQEYVPLQEKIRLSTRQELGGSRQTFPIRSGTPITSQLLR